MGRSGGSAAQLAGCDGRRTHGATSRGLLRSGQLEGRFDSGLRDPGRMDIAPKFARA